MKCLVLFLICLCPFSVSGQQPKLMLPVGHTSGVSYAVFSPDGKKVATASRFESVKLWSSEDGTLLVDLKEPKNLGKSIDFSLDGKKILTSSWDSTAKIWDTENGKVLVVLKGHTDGIILAIFFPDDKRILTSSVDSTAKIWDSETGKLRLVLKEQTGYFRTAVISPDGNLIVTVSGDNTIKVWDSHTGVFLRALEKHTARVNTANFSPDGTKIVTASNDNTIKVWDSVTGSLLLNITGHSNSVHSAVFSHDGKMILSSSADYTSCVWSAETGGTLDMLPHSDEVRSATYSPDGTKIVTVSADHTTKIWDSRTSNLLANLVGHSLLVNSATFSPDGTKLVTASDDYTAKVWDSQSGDLLTDLVGHSFFIHSATFSSDGTKLVTASSDSTVRIWNTATGSLEGRLVGHTDEVKSAAFSPDGSKIITASFDQTARIWETQNGSLLLDLVGHSSYVLSAVFSPDGSKVLTSSEDNTAKVWDSESGILLADFIGHKRTVISASFSPDGKKIVTTSYDSTAKIWNTASGALLADLNLHSDRVKSAAFSPDGQTIVTISADHTFKLWNVQTGRLILNINTDWIFMVRFSSDGRNVITVSRNGIVRYWDSKTGEINKSIYLNLKFLFTDIHLVSNMIIGNDESEIVIIDLNGNRLRKLIAIDAKDYLIYDDHGRYDGTEAARKLLYFTCDKEVITLDQVKDQLWVPNLAERISKGEPINAPKLSELSICGLPPLIEIRESDKGYRFIITPRKGGLGETALYVNDIEVKRYKHSELLKKQSTYELQIADQTLKEYFIPGKENAVTVKAFTQKNDIASRGATSIRRPESKDDIAPNLYAIMVGVSDYKGEELDLKYAAKDASDLSNAVAASARKLLNRDGSEHVFMYNLTTGENRTKFPEKEAIKQVFDEIGKKATSKDILLIFFAGHGVMEGEKKQFYFLTADASKNSDITTSGISIAELNEWMKPQQIKAQKRVLIFDACNSGQAINDLVTIGNTDDQYIAARNDDETNRIKAVEKLNERSGMFILSASASNQSAYEMGRYSQGLLTYALLKAIREDPAILEDGKLLNVDKWFVKAEKTVTDMVSGMENRQQPQKFGTGGFNIGEVDKEIISGIALAQEKPLFGGSLFLNPIAGDDDIDLTQKVNEQLNSLSIRGEESKISFIASTNDPSAYKLTGTYEISGDNLKVNINIKQKEFKYRFEVTGVVKDLASVAEEIVKKAEEYIQRR